VVLDAFETASKDVNVTALRPRLEHAQILTETDLQRVGKLGGEHSNFALVSMKVNCRNLVISSIQPTHAYVELFI